MKTYTTILAVVTVVMLFAADLNAQMPELEVTDAVLTNLTNAIASDNPMLSKSGALMAGKYEIVELVPVLIEELETETDVEMKAAYALALYEIREAAGLTAVVAEAMKAQDKTGGYTLHFISNAILDAAPVEAK